MSEVMAKAFHEAYERLAPSFGYETRQESAVPWEKVPERNRRLMIAVCDEVMGKLPKTADGAPAYPGMEVWFYNSHAIVRSVYDGGEYGFCVTVEDEEGPQGFVPLKDACSNAPEMRK